MFGITNKASTMKTRRSAMYFAATLLMAASGIGGMASSASAQSSGWEIACARKVDSPENGDTMREFLCTRQRDCQSNANRKGAATFSNGCFGVAPAASYLK